MEGSEKIFLSHTFQKPYTRPRSGIFIHHDVFCFCFRLGLVFNNESISLVFCFVLFCFLLSQCSLFLHFLGKYLERIRIV